MEHFELYIQRAERASSQAEWLSMTSSGKEAVLAEWEAAALLVLTDPEVLAEEKAALSENLENRLAEGLADWVIRNLEREMVPSDMSDYWARLHQAALEETFEMDGGRPVRDNAGDPVVKAAEQAQWDEDSLVFRNRWKNEAQNYLDEWYGGVESAFSELFARLRPEQRTLLEERKEASLQALRASQSREMAKLLDIEQSMMARYRLKDIYSLRRELESRSAQEQVGELINEVQSEIEEGLARLRSELEYNPDSNAVDEASIDAERWRESFREELEKGLHLWDDAEEKLLVDRAVWEQKAGYDLAGAEEAWSQAFEELRHSRHNWLGEYQQVLEQGRSLWENQNREMENAIAQAQAELDYSIDTQRASLQERGEALVDILGQSLQMRKNAHSTFVYWLNKACPGKPLASEDLSWQTEEMQAVLDEYSLQAENTGDDAEQSPLSEAAFWLRTYATYSTYAREAREELLATFNLTVLGESGLDISGLSGPVDGLSEGGWEELFLDEYQVELLKARAVAAYWEKELSVAEQVLEYAQEDSSSRPTEAETEAEYAESLSYYRLALQEYRSRISELESADDRLSGNRERIALVQEELSGLKAELEEAHKVYRNKLLLFELNSPQYYQKRMREAYFRFRELSGLDEDTAASCTSAFADYLAASSACAGEDFLKNTTAVLNSLVQGNYEEVPPRLPLEDLKTRYTSALSWNTEDFLEQEKPRSDFLENVRTYWSIGPQDSAYNRIENLCFQLKQSDSTPQDLAYFRLNLETVLGELRRSYRMEQEAREAQIALLSSCSAEDKKLLWASQTAAISNGMSSDEISAALREDARAAFFRVVNTRVASDLQVLKNFKTRLQSWLDAGNAETAFQISVPSNWQDADEVFSWLYFQRNQGGLLDSLVQDIDQLKVLAGLPDGSDLSTEEQAEQWRSLIGSNSFV